MLLRSLNTTSSTCRTSSTRRTGRGHSVTSGSTLASAWLVGTGSMQLYNLMEDAAVTEISRVQNWQWIRYGADVDADRHDSVKMLGSSAAFDAGLLRLRWMLRLSEALSYQVLLQSPRSKMLLANCV